MKIDDIVQGFSTTPFLFIGSGFSRRYYSLPNWEALLKVFIQRLSTDEFAFNAYLDKAKKRAAKKHRDERHLTVVAELLEKDFNQRWYDDTAFRTLNDDYMQFVKHYHSPLKVEIAQYLDHHSQLVDRYQDEIALFQKVAQRSITGIITTNYDLLLDTLIGNYTVYVGQEELIFSTIQGIAEIYKIHGSISNPASLILTAEDYHNFDTGSPYLAAKLMTIFMEYPILFIGYSISDPNIQAILESIVRCLSDENLEKLQHRFVYIEWVEDQKPMKISPSIMTILNKAISMTRITTGDYTPIFKALLKKHSTLPVDRIRFFREAFYRYTQTSTPTDAMMVVGIDETNNAPPDLVLAIGKASLIGVKGLKGLTAEEWYKNIVTGYLFSKFSADDILENAYPALVQANKTLPVWRLIRLSNKLNCSEYERHAPHTFNEIIPPFIQKAKATKLLHIHSISGIQKAWNKKSISCIMLHIAYLDERDINIHELKTFLTDLLRDRGFYTSLTNAGRSHFHRLVRIYDYLAFYTPVHKAAKP